eukprot:COSAG06_NODE_4204_length_4480_cov_3.149509_3_plen_287_part_00
MASGLMDQVAAGKAGLFATFGGQGYPYIAEAQELYAQDAAGAFMKPIVAALEAAAASDEVRLPSSTLFLKPLLPLHSSTLGACGPPSSAPRSCLTALCAAGEGGRRARAGLRADRVARGRGPGGGLPSVRLGQLPAGRADAARALRRDAGQARQDARGDGLQGRHRPLAGRGERRGAGELRHDRGAQRQRAQDGASRESNYASLFSSPLLSSPGRAKRPGQARPACRPAHPRHRPACACRLPAARQYRAPSQPHPPPCRRACLSRVRRSRTFSGKALAARRSSTTS